MKFRLVDRLSESGHPHNISKNDDAHGVDDRVAIVADGATGLWEGRLSDHPVSDARWIADLTVKGMLAARADDPVRDLVADTIQRARNDVGYRDDSLPIPRFAWPASSFVMARLQTGVLEISGLGDCVAYVLMDDGYVERFSALSENSGRESDAARRDLLNRKSAPASSMVQGIHVPEILSKLREKRARANTPESDVWTVSLEPQAADYIMTMAIPLTEARRVLLASDGFSAAFDRYEIMTPQAFMSDANVAALPKIQAEIRTIERETDPHAERFPRYKQSDDSTAILLEIDK